MPLLLNRGFLLFGGKMYKPFTKYDLYAGMKVLFQTQVAYFNFMRYEMYTDQASNLVLPFTIKEVREDIITVELYENGLMCLPFPAFNNYFTVDTSSSPIKEPFTAQNARLTVEAIKDEYTFDLRRIIEKNIVERANKGYYHYWCNKTERMCEEGIRREIIPYFSEMGYNIKNEVGTIKVDWSKDEKDMG